MLAKFELKGVHTTVDEALRRYTHKKLGRLDRYLPRRWRESVHAIVELKEGKAKDNNKYTCEVTMHLPHGTLNVTESTLNMYAAIDIVETKLKQQIKKYKEVHTNGKVIRRLTARFRRSMSQEPQPEA